MKTDLLAPGIPAASSPSAASRADNRAGGENQTTQDGPTDKRDGAASSTPSPNDRAAASRAIALGLRGSSYLILAFLAITYLLYPGGHSYLWSTLTHVLYPQDGRYRHDLPHDPHRFPPAIFHHLGQYSPYFAPALYQPPPAGCVVDQVSVLHRHGSRYPTEGAARVIRPILARLQEAVKDLAEPCPELEFLKSYTYDLGTEGLVPFGIQESEDSGVEAYARYEHLLSKGVSVRSTSSSRVLHTAKSWSKGFHDASGGVAEVPSPLVISDARGSNDTLANNNCPNFVSRHKHWEWAEQFTAPIISRLQEQFAGKSGPPRDEDSTSPGITLTPRDIIVLFGMCAFESVHRNATSDFCHLFTREEFLYFEYFQDLEKYYNRGYGNPTGRAQGTGYVNELLARLTGTAVQDATQTNTTLDSNPKTFPLGRGMYADFSHDNTMAAIVSAMGLFRSHGEHDLPSDRLPRHRSWRFGHIAPFAGRIIFERLQCRSTQASASTTSAATAPYIRVLANDAPLDLRELCGTEDFRRLGTQWRSICTLDAFVRSQKYARVDGQVEFRDKCGWRPAPDLLDHVEMEHDASMEGNL